MARGLDLPLPGPVLGLAFLLVALRFERVSTAVEPVARVLLANLSLLFVPAGVGVVGHLGLITESGFSILIAIWNRHRRRRHPWDEVSIVSVDLAKQVFQVRGAAPDGRVLFRKKLSRPQFAKFMATLPPCVVAMEVCGTAHYWGREPTRHGHGVRLIPPAYVKPYVKRQKNDSADAEAVAEAALRPTMRSVAVKTAGQQAHAMLFRTRDLLVGQRTQLVNVLRGHLAEHSVGAIVALNFVALIDDHSRFWKAENVGAFLGLTPRRHQSGEIDWSGRVSKCGDGVMRSLRFEAATTLITQVQKFSARKSWDVRLAGRRGFAKAAVATARKLAVLMLTLRKNETEFTWTKEAVA